MPERLIKPAAIVVAVLLATGCQKRVTALQLETQQCPLVAVVAVGRMVNFYAIHVDIAGHDSALLVPNIDMPGDEPQYVKYLRPSPTGVDIGVFNLDYVRDLTIRVSNSCVVKTVKVGA